MAVLVGIDEAGFGPILGPLVISSSTFSIPEHLLKADLWQVLHRGVGKQQRALAGRLLMTDSKKAYNKKRGIKHIKRTVLACLKCLDKTPATLTELLSMLCPDVLGRLEAYPWYQDSGGYEISADQNDLLIASEVFKDDMASNNMKFLGISSCCLDVGRFNKMVTAVKNKNRVLFTATSRLIQRAFDAFAGDRLLILVDRQGGRIHYRKILQRMFPDMGLRILHESPAESSYELQKNGKSMHLRFAVGADECFLPVSLASMASKFVRELLVDNINRYFAGYCDGLKPTAGYWTDGLRFIEDLKRHIPDAQLDTGKLIRCR